MEVIAAICNVPMIRNGNSRINIGNMVKMTSQSGNAAGTGNDSREMCSTKDNKKCNRYKQNGAIKSGTAIHVGTQREIPEKLQKQGECQGWQNAWGFSGMPLKKVCHFSHC